MCGPGLSSAQCLGSRRAATEAAAGSKMVAIFWYFVKMYLSLILYLKPFVPSGNQTLLLLLLLLVLLQH